MKVKELKAQLESYKDNDDLLVLYWDKDFADNYAQGVSGELSPEQWAKVVSQVESIQMLQIDDIGDYITEAVDEVTREEEGV